ncbi:MAG: dihydroorotase [Alphaproteobacteria bacterium]|nr:dihydroorotase [Alphaproteobacteria bacterium]HCQ70538.1 dihydroorotase [Rhodospirillaceae bacterium]|tara:strand:+ start:67238 stop:68341 length:1104 start_codon:yes stop_codon:yes gene_type:complete
MALSLTLPKWYDLHTHLRQGALLKPIIQSQLDMGCCGVLAMPNTKPPAAKVFKDDPLAYWSIEEYRAMINAAGGDQFDDFITPMYLTKDTTPQMIEDGAKAGLLRAVKYYPPHGTTGADFSYPLVDLLKTDVIKALEDNNVTMCIHGEEHALPGEAYFDRETNAEEFFYRERMPRLLDAFPNLKIVGEHMTTKVAVDLVLQAGDNIAASITPQHLIYTVGHLVQGFKYHLFCLPLVKFDEDRAALRSAVLDPNNTKFFAGTDSAAHTVKATDCGCAAGCFTGGIAPQLYAEGFEAAGADLSDAQTAKAFEAFLCRIGPNFHGLKISEDTFTLTKTPQKVYKTPTDDGDITPLPIGLGHDSVSWSLSL